MKRVEEEEWGNVIVDYVTVPIGICILLPFDLFLLMIQFSSSNFLYFFFSFPLRYEGGSEVIKRGCFLRAVILSYERAKKSNCTIRRKTKKNRRNINIRHDKNEGILDSDRSNRSEIRKQKKNMKESEQWR